MKRYVIAAFLSLTRLLAGQIEPATLATDPAPEKASTISARPSAEALGPGDLLSIAVATWPDANRNYRISDEGTLTIPVLKQPLTVTGMTTSQIEQVMTQAFVAEKVLVDPMISVNVVEYRSKTVEVAGAVRHPITFQALGSVRLLDAIAKADGLSLDAGPEILISQSNEPSSGTKIQHIPVKDLLEGNDSSWNLLLHGGEQIRVPEAGKLYVVGNVKLPGMYPFGQGQGLSLLKALALCQGLLPYSQDTAVVYRTEIGSSARKEIEVPLKQILKRQTPDVALKPNDILYIPDNSGKRLSAHILDRIGSFGGATVSGVLIWK